MKRKHHKGQQHYSGKELLEQRNAERKEQEKRLEEEKKETGRERALTVFTQFLSDICFLWGQGIIRVWDIPVSEGKAAGRDLVHGSSRLSRLHRCNFSFNQEVLIWIRTYCRST